MKKEKYNVGICILAIMFMIPSLIICWYTYPVQDDFHYAYYARELMSEGHNIFSMAFLKTVEYYKTFCGCYTSSFLGYFFSGIINCNIIGIRLFCFISMIIFYGSLYLFIRSLMEKVFQISQQISHILYLMFVFTLTGLIYYAENEDYYWFITSVQYLLITSLILLGIHFFILGICTEKKRFYVLAAVFGFWGSGGALNIAAMCCLLYVFITGWGIIYKKGKTKLLLTFAIVLAGGLLNGLAPGNYIRHSAPLTAQSIIQAMIQSYEYVFLRLEHYIKEPCFMLILVLTIIILVVWRPEITLKNYKHPFLFILMMISGVAIVIFPVMLGYGWDCYLIICRCNFISDLMLFLSIMLFLIYIRGWLYRICSKVYIVPRAGIIMVIASLVVGGLVLNTQYAKGTALYRQVTELRQGKYKEYADYCVEIYQEVLNSTEKEVIIYKEKMVDETCLIDPQLLRGKYDYENEHGNRTIARFYHKDAVYIFPE